MAKVRLRGQENGATTAPQSEEVAGPIPLKPLEIAGVIIRREVLVDALRAYVGPQLEDVQAFEDGQHFFLKLRQASGEQQ